MRIRALDISAISHVEPSFFSRVKVTDGRSPTLKLPSELPAPETEAIATFTPGASCWRVSSVGVAGGTLSPGAPGAPSSPSLPLQAERRRTAAKTSATRPGIGNGAWEIFTASLQSPVWQRERPSGAESSATATPHLWHPVQESPLSTCGSGAERPWHCRQFIPGVWFGGIGDASRWLGVPRWQEAQ